MLPHMFDSAWKEVILLTAGLVSDSSKFLRGLKKCIDSSLKSSEQLQELLWWATLKSDLTLRSSPEMNYRSAAVRAFYLQFLSPRYTKVFLNIKIVGKVDSRLLDDWNKTYAPQELDPCREIVMDWYLMTAFDYAGQRAEELETNFEYVHTGLYPDHHIRLVMNLSSDNDFKRKLESLIPEMESRKIPENVAMFKTWWKSNHSDWINRYCATIAQYRNIGWAWKFNREDVDLIMEYMDTSELLLDCITESHISSEQSLAIKDELFLPFTFMNTSLAELQSLANVSLKPDKQTELCNLLTRQAEASITNEETETLDRLLEQVEQLDLLRVRAHYTLQHLSQSDAA
jgi:hypothetical protein